MGRQTLMHKIKSVDEELEDCKSTCFDIAAFARTINSEVAAAVAVLKSSVKWDTSRSDRLEHSLVQSLMTLRKQIYGWKDPWHTINPAVYLQPFLDVIRSDETDALVTCVALSSVYKILTLEVPDLNLVNPEEAMILVVDTMTDCRFQLLDPSPTSSDEVEMVLMKMFHVLVTCMKSKASFVLSNQQVCSILKICSRVFDQTYTKGESLQPMAQQTLSELVRRVFLHLSAVNNSKLFLAKGASPITEAPETSDGSYGFQSSVSSSSTAEPRTLASSVSSSSTAEPRAPASSVSSSSTAQFSVRKVGVPCDVNLDNASCGVPGAVEIFQFLFSLLKVLESPGLKALACDEEMPLFALALINSAIELGGPFICKQPQLMSMVKEELFCILMRFGLAASPRILSVECSIVLNSYHHFRSELKLQLEDFFSCILLRLAQSRNADSYGQQEVAMEALLDFCRQKNFLVEMYINLDCDLTCCNIFEHLANLLSKSAYPVKGSLSSMNLLALDGLASVIHGIAERIRDGINSDLVGPVDSLKEYSPFWMVKCDDYTDPDQWVPFVRRRKCIKSMLMIGADRFNRNRVEGLEYLLDSHLLPEKLDPHDVACFLRYTAGLDKEAVGKFLGLNHEYFVQVLNEFTSTFDFEGMDFETALRLFLGAFHLPGKAESRKNVIEAFSERYHKQCPDTLADKDAVILLSISVWMLSTCHHCPELGEKMTEEEFVRINSRINGGSDLPRVFLSKLYQSVCENEICTNEMMGFPEKTPSQWVGLMNKSKKTAEFIVSDSNAYVDYDMFVIMARPAIAAISVVFDHAEHEQVYRTCLECFLDIAKISSIYRLEDVLDDVVVSLCKLTTLLNVSPVDEVPVPAFGDDLKARRATATVFTIAGMYGDFIRAGWRSITDCAFKLHKLGFMPAFVFSVDDDTEVSSRRGQENPIASSNFPSLQLIDDIFTKRKFLQADSLLHLTRAFIRPHLKGGETEDEEGTAVYYLELLVKITLNNREMTEIIWQDVYGHLTNIVQSTVIPGPLIEKAVFGLVSICQSLLSYKEELADELLRLVLKLNPRVADAYSEKITQEVGHLIKTNAPHICSPMVWQTVTSLLSIAAHHPEGSEAGFDALFFIMSEGAHLRPDNFALCIDSARQFSESRIGQVDRSLRSLDLMASSVVYLAYWSQLADKTGLREKAETITLMGDMWMCLAQALGKVCLDQREDVRNNALYSLIKCLVCWDEVHLPKELWLQCFDLVLFRVVDDLLEIAQGSSQKYYRNIIESLSIALKVLVGNFLTFIKELSQLTAFGKLWLGVLGRMEMFVKVKLIGIRPEELYEIVSKLLEKALLVMKTNGLLVQRGALGGENLWDLTWFIVQNISPDLNDEFLSGQALELSLPSHTTVPFTKLITPEGACVQGYRGAGLCDV